MIADALRKSILQQAIQGKLSEQLPTDGDALFENYSFAKNNVVSKSMQQILDILDTGENDSAQLEKFYNSVRRRCSVAKTAEDKQKIIIELYVDTPHALRGCVASVLS